MTKLAEKVGAWQNAAFRARVEERRIARQAEVRAKIRRARRKLGGKS